jgi:L-lactate dehydrogenase
VAWSCSALYGTPLLSVLPLTEQERDEIATATRQKAENIIKVKGFTSYGVAAATARICESIIFDQRQVLTLSHWQEDFGCCLSVPTVLGRGGVVSTVPLRINELERGLLQKSADSLQKAMENVLKET